MHLLLPTHQWGAPIKKISVAALYSPARRLLLVGVDYSGKETLEKKLKEFGFRAKSAAKRAVSGCDAAAVEKKKKKERKKGRNSGERGT